MRRVAFAVFGTLALLTHYAAGLFLAACALTPAVLAALEPRYRAAWRRALPRRVAADAATFLLPAAVAASLVLGQARPWLHRLSHVAGFYFDPARETVAGFLARALADTFNLFSPLRIDTRASNLEDPVACREPVRDRPAHMIGVPSMNRMSPVNTTPASGTWAIVSPCVCAGPSSIRSTPRSPTRSSCRPRTSRSAAAR